MKTLVISDACAAELALALSDASTPSPTPAPTPSPSPSPDTSGFAHAHLIDLRWGTVGTGNVSVFTRDWGGFGCLDAIAVRFVAPAVPQSSPTSLGRIAAASYVDQPVMRMSKLSDKAFDFDGAFAGSDTAGAQFSVGVSVTRSGMTYPKLECGAVYYFNICNRDKSGAPTCAPGQSANMIIQLYKPAGL